MIITDKEYGRFNVYLGDDGTLDTIISVSRVDETEGFNESTEHEIRFSDTSYIRDETGAMTDKGFAELAEEAVEVYVEQYLI